MDYEIEKALEKMDSVTRDIVKGNIQLFKKNGDYKYLKEAVAIIMNYIDEDARKVEEMVKRMI